MYLAVYVIVQWVLDFSGQIRKYICFNIRFFETGAMALHFVIWLGFSLHVKFPVLTTSCEAPVIAEGPLVFGEIQIQKIFVE